MPNPTRESLQRHAQAIALMGWIDGELTGRDYESFNTEAAREKYLPEWTTDLAKQITEPDNHDLAFLLVEVTSTEAMTLGQIVQLPENDFTAEQAKAVRANASLLLATPRKRKHKANLSWVTKQIATGGDFALIEEVFVDQLQDLLDENLDLIIDCRTPNEADDTELWETVAEKFGSAPQYVQLPTTDEVGHRIPASHFEAAFTAAEPVLAEGGTVFVHCHMGVNRGPSTAFYLLLKQGMEPTAAFDLIRATRPQAGLYYAEDAMLAAGLEAQLDDFLEHVRSVFLPSEQRKIAHVMREQHESDRRQVEEGRL